MLRSARRRPRMAPRADIEPPEPTRLGEVLWLEPYPDALLDGIADTAAGPEERTQGREAISLAFITALQLLPPRQRAALILRDVLEVSAQEVAGLLDTTEQSVTSALKRARARLAREMPALSQPAPPLNSPTERALLKRLVRAFEDGDVNGIVATMSDDVWVRMPPLPFEYQGKQLARRFFTTVAFRQDRRYRLLPAHANGQPAFGVYLRDPPSKIATAFGVFVVTVTDDQIAAITRFEVDVMQRFGFPRTLAD
jgi:RNA polymerase sigma-70 factor (TIGR02960 family)